MSWNLVVVGKRDEVAEKFALKVEALRSHGSAATMAILDGQVTAVRSLTADKSNNFINDTPHLVLVETTGHIDATYGHCTFNVKSIFDT